MFDILQQHDCGFKKNISIYLVEISVCLFKCSIITLEPLDQFALEYNGEFGRSMEMLLVWFKSARSSGFITLLN